MDVREQRALIEAAPRKVRAIITLALLTEARIGELLELPWAHVGPDVLVFLNTKNGHQRRLPVSRSVQAA